MALRTKRINIKLPPHLINLLQTLSEKGRLFLKQYESKEERMQAIASELGKISKKVNELQKGANIMRLMGASCGGFGIMVSVGAAFLLAVSSTGDRAAQMAALGFTAAVGGGASVITANVFKAVEERISTETVERMGGEFMQIVEELKGVLEEIKKVSEELEEKSSSLITKTGAQAKSSLLNTNQLENILVQTAEVAERSRQALEASLTMQGGVKDLLNLITQIIPTPEDAELRNSITGSASQCEKTVKEFAKMKETLKDFEEMQKE